MAHSADSYISIDHRSRFTAQAFRVWVLTALIVLLWTGLTVAAPVLLRYGLGAISSPIYSFFSFLCHQMPERSIHVAGHQFAVCSRCFGVYFGLLLGTLIYPLWRSVDETEPIPRIWLFLSLVPITIDWSLTVFGIWENTHLSRLITGGVLGFVCATFIVPALVEIVRNLSAGGRTPHDGQPSGGSFSESN